MGFPDGSGVKNLPAKHQMLVRNLGQEDPWGRNWQRTPVFLPQKSHRQRSLVGYSPWSRKELDTTELLNNNNKTKQKYKQSMWKWGIPHSPLGRLHANWSFLLASSPLWSPVSLWESHFVPLRAEALLFSCSEHSAFSIILALFY